jgi:hypothetical protein
VTVVPAEPVVLEQGGAAWAWTAVEITAAYDLTRRADSVRLAPRERLAAAVREQAAYLDRLLSLGRGEVVALRIVRGESRRLRIWLAGRVTAATAPAAADRAAALSAQLAGVPAHVAVAPVPRAADVQAVLAPFAPAAGGIAQIGKRLRVHATVRPDAGVGAYLAVEPFSREIEHWVPLLEALCAHPHPVAVTVALTPEVVPPTVRATLEREATRYARLREPFEVPADTGGRIRYPADGAAALIEPIFRDGLTRYTDRVFRFAVTVVSSRPLDEAIVQAAARTMSAAPAAAAARHDPTTVPTGYAILRPRTADQFETLRNAFASLEPVTLPDAELARHLRADGDAARHGLAVLRTLIDRTEALSVFRLPVAVDGQLPGVRVSAPPDAPRVVAPVDGPSLLLGRQGPGGAEVRFAVADLPRHGFIVGTPGSGKTNTALHLCRQLWDQRIPFLVIEPVNAGLDDYRWLATRPDFADLLVLTVGDEDVAPLRLNPFEVPAGGTVSSHIANLLACFEAAFGLWDPLPFIYRRAMVRAYRRRGLHPADRGGAAARWPVLPDLVAALAEVTAELGYSGEVAHNIDAAARLRAEALLEGACGPTLNCRRSFDLAALLRRPVVLELAGVGDNAKEQSLVTLLLLTALRGHRRSAASVDPVPHVLFIEEAHRIFPRATGAAGGGQAGGGSAGGREAGAQALAAERIAQGLAEDRKYRQAYVLIDQQVGKVAEDAYKIANLKVMHRTAAEEDRRLLGSTMSMHADQVESAAALAPFQAVVSHNALDRAVIVTVPDVRAEDAAARGVAEAPLAGDAEIRERFVRLLAEPAFAEAMAPFEECHGCRHRCAFRRQAESIMADRTMAARLVGLAQPGAGGWPALARDLIRLAGAAPVGVFVGAPVVRSAGAGSAGPAPVVEASGPAPVVDAADGAEDYRVCVFIHAFRAAFPPAEWSDEGQRRAVRWADRARRELQATVRT